MNIKGFLMWSKDYRLDWEQLCNLAFCLGVDHDQLVAAVIEMRSPSIEWMDKLYNEGFISKEQYQKFWNSKKVNSPMSR